MRRTNVVNAKNQDTLHDTAFISDAMNVMNMDISSWTALTKILPPGTPSATSQGTQKPPHQIEF